MRTPIAIILFLGILCCRRSDKPNQDSPSAFIQDQVYSGTYSLSFEHSYFRQKGSKELWWVDREKPIIDKYISDHPQQSGKYLQSPTVHPIWRFEITVKGHIGPEGMYGHLGMYRRELTISDVVSVEEKS
jgi:hypothetical protein